MLMHNNLTHSVVVEFPVLPRRKPADLLVDFRESDALLFDQKAVMISLHLASLLSFVSKAKMGAADLHLVSNDRRTFYISINPNWLWYGTFISNLLFKCYLLADRCSIFLMQTLKHLSDSFHFCRCPQARFLLLRLNYWLGVPFYAGHRWEVFAF